ncbi:hypothetical protein L6164_013138 [Bauhinia variegata]|uniref:Uncharacterized protein n=1 Tax=Bauhinia variegata TaxID=167791 RepID=A0ACB9PCH8_BAUVA|nr:hypothetical protein L6164_013138 [Bauhinia variegata]
MAEKTEIYDAPNDTVLPMEINEPTSGFEQEITSSTVRMCSRSKQSEHNERTCQSAVAAAVMKNESNGKEKGKENVRATNEGEKEETNPFLKELEGKLEEWNGGEASSQEGDDDLGNKWIRLGGKPISGIKLAFDFLPISWLPPSLVMLLLGKMDGEAWRPVHGVHISKVYP